MTEARVVGVRETPSTLVSLVSLSIAAWSSKLRSCEFPDSILPPLLLNITRPELKHQCNLRVGLKGSGIMTGQELDEEIKMAFIRLKALVEELITLPVVHYHARELLIWKWLRDFFNSLPNCKVH